MADKDVRWIQRLEHFAKAVSQLENFIEKKRLNKLEKQGLIQAFEYTYELAWNVLKDYFENQGEINLFGSRDVFRLAFRRGLIEDGETWMDMIKSRSLTSHTYNEDLVEPITAKIAQSYSLEFKKLNSKMKSLKKNTPP